MADDTTPHPSIAAIGDRIGRLITAHIDRAFRRIMPGPNVDIHRGFVRMVTGQPHPFGNFACMSDDPADLATTRAAIDPLLRCQAPSAVLFTGAAPPDVEDVLAGVGFARHGGMPAMAVEIDRLKPVSLPAGYDFARVASSALRAEWGDVFARGYELPGPVGAVFGGGINDDDRPDAPVQYFWILKSGRPVCTSLVVFDDGVAGIYGVATLPDERGRGLGAFVTAEPLRIARRLGYRVGVLQASEAGHPVYRRLGFGEFGEVPLYVRMPA